MTGDLIPAEVYEQGLTPFEARALTDEIRQTLTVGHGLLIRAYTGGAAKALGYESWDAYCAGEFAEARMVRLDREQRREIVAEMRAEGMSSRAIASGLGVDQKTVVNDQRAGEELSSPAPVITGTDGKTYQPPVRPRRPPAPTVRRLDVVTTMTTVLTRARIAADAAEKIKPSHLSDRPDEAAAWRGHLAASIATLTQLLSDLENT